MVFSGNCSMRGAHSDSLRRCQGLCGGSLLAAEKSHAAYCSKACQARDWKSGHKRVCGKIPPGFAIEVQAETGRLLLRCTDNDKNMHPFCNFLGTFFRELVPYLEGDPELVKIEYSTPIKVGGDVKFKCNCYLPKAAVERAKVDSDFDNALSHSVAFAYDDELLAAARANNVKCDCGSDEPVSKVFHSPMTKAVPGRYVLMDMFAKPCCSNGECMRKIKGRVVDFHQGLARTMREMGVTGGRQQN